MAALAVGVEVTGVQSELPAALSSALQGEKARFLVVPLSHPRYRRDFRRPRNEPMTHSDLQLHSQQVSYESSSCDGALHECSEVVVAKALQICGSAVGQS